MKKLFKGLLIVIIIIVAAVMGYNQYDSWQNEKDLAEQAVSPQGQLPENVIPTHYDLSLRINPEQGTFSGKVKIAVTLTARIEQLWLHGKDFNVSLAQFITEKGDTFPLKYQEMGHSGVVSLLSSQPLLPQHGAISIEFSGQLADDLAGLYKVEEAGLSYVFSQFEATDARRAFPSFDEPRFKTPFDIQLEVKSHHQGITNTPQINEKSLTDGFKQLTFSTTKPLPTYLLAFVVGEVDVVDYANIPTSKIRSKEIPFRGIATKGKGKEMEYALANTASILAALEAYFDMPYPYEKLDIVAVPDFRAGAMENAGLITYREQLLLLGENPSLSQQRSYAATHAHELAHQWFGNLVTMRWWDDLWLNESFATWMANVTMQKWNPEFGFERAMVRGGHGVMKQDIYADTRKIREPIKHNGDIDNAFDGITYQKGGAVLQMLEAYVGAENFRKGVRSYMKKYAFGHATAQDFISEIEAFSNQDNIKAAFNSFLNQKGVPLVSVDYQCENNHVQFSLTQERYLPVGARSPKQQSWALPICLQIIGKNENSKSCTLITDVKSTLILENTECPIAVMPNATGKGYYRWSLPADKLSSLLANMSRVNSSEKYSIASMLAAEFKAGRIDVKTYINAITPFAGADDWDLVTQPVGMIKFIAERIAKGDQQQELLDYLSELYQPVLDRVGLNPDTELDKTHPNDAKLLRQEIVSLMSMGLKQPELLKELATMGVAYSGYSGALMNKGQGDGSIHPEGIDPDTIGIALASAVEVHGMPFVEYLVTLLDESDDGMLRQRILVAIAMSEDEHISEKVLDLVTSFSLRVNERITLLVTHMQRKKNTKKVYEWVKSNFELVGMLIPKQYLSQSPLIANGFCSKEMQQDVEAFFAPKKDDIPGLDRNLSKVLERIEICSSIALRQSDG
ncbi:MAG: M1 family metallopeptidase [Colwellia sp.]|nr:M1 family metallopeptidase [Colwellia sp.]